MEHKLGIVGGDALTIGIEVTDPDDPARVTPPTLDKPEPWAVTFMRPDGSSAGHGFPYTVWYWQVLTQREIDLLRGMVTVGGTLHKSRRVYLKTRKPDDPGTYGYYTAWMHWPEGLSDKRQKNGLYYDVEILFTKLETYAP